ncbi:MAG: anthranilate phosphoribosyltransferase [Candidatus Didemnitutus sp.]|nr:anthranilate phosphoribosyltransferase [Candidatus Didemnitutus sp.]
MLHPLTEMLLARHDLAPSAAQAAALALAQPDVPEGEKIDFLAALAMKGETAAEIAAFATVYRRQAKDPGVGEWAPRAIDIVGTGGDHAGGFNISTLVTFTLASTGAVVMKHGNVGMTSKCGSADLIAALGVDLQATPEKSRAALRELGFCFFFAPAYHSAFRHVVPARKALAARGQRTIFNLLGPLINPGRPAHTLLGVYAPTLLPKFAAALEALGSTAGVVAHGVIDAQRGIDEITSTTNNHVITYGRWREVECAWQPEDFGLTRAPFADLIGGDVAMNVGITKAILCGTAPQGLVDTIVLNTAVALWILGQTPSVRDGLPLAREALLGGAVAKKIAATGEFYRS